MRIKNVAGYIRQAEHISIVIGAGASRSAGIPTGPELVKRINEQLPDHICRLSADKRQDYGHVMGALSPETRKNLIEPLLQESRINWGHIALACIIQSANIKRILSFNFDLVLERAASLLGMHLPVYDFAVAPTRHVNRLPAPAIFHLHGQSYGLRLMNAADETSAHKEELRPLLGDSVRHHLTIVIGYSGESDPAFDVLAEEFASQNDLIWLGHDKEPKPHLTPLLNQDYATYVGGCDFDLTMIEIAKELGCWPPQIFENPPLHVLEELQEVADYPVQAETEVDILTSTRERLDLAGKAWSDTGGSEARSFLAFLSGTEQDAIEDYDTLSERERVIRAWSEIEDGNRCFNKAQTLSGDARTDAFRAAGERYAEAIRIKPDMHEAFNNWGNALAKEAEGLPGDARDKAFKLAGEKYAGAIRLKSDKYESFNNWGLALANEARGLSGNAQANAFRAAGDKYAEATRINPDEDDAFKNWCIALADEAQCLNGDARAAKLKEAEDKAKLAKAITGEASFNLACVYSLQAQIENALDELEACFADGTLPARHHLESDSDLDPLRDEPRFKALFEKA